jgi:Raf kinase inhibitor-like YbhB/YbcL family protein
MALELSSPAFRDQGAIPPKFTSEAENCSPPLQWRDPPADAQSLALVVVDPDAPDPQAPKRTFTHWVLYNLPPESRGLHEGVTRSELPAGTLQGKNDFGKVQYDGPSPPIGEHRYFFKLYALDAPLPDLHAPGRQKLEAAMEGHILAETELMGTYRKHG